MKVSIAAQVALCVVAWAAVLFPRLWAAEQPRCEWRSSEGYIWRNDMTSAEDPPKEVTFYYKHNC